MPLNNKVSCIPIKNQHTDITTSKNHISFFYLSLINTMIKKINYKPPKNCAHFIINFLPLQTPGSTLTFHELGSQLTLDSSCPLHHLLPLSGLKRIMLSNSLFPLAVLVLKLETASSSHPNSNPSFSENNSPLSRMYPSTLVLPKLILTLPAAALGLRASGSHFLSLTKSLQNPTLADGQTTLTSYGTSPSALTVRQTCLDDTTAILFTVPAFHFPSTITSTYCPTFTCLMAKSLESAG